MPSFPMNSVGQYVTMEDGNASATAGAPILVTAGGAGDNVKVDGATIDRKNGTALAHSAKVGTGFLFALADTKTISLAHEIQESSDGSSWDTAEVIEASTVKATSDGGTNERGVDEHSIDLMGRKRYFRINVTPDLSATATDDGFVFTIVALGGWDQIPTS